MDSRELGTNRHLSRNTCGLNDSPKNVTYTRNPSRPEGASIINPAIVITTPDSPYNSKCHKSRVLSVGYVGPMRIGSPLISNLQILLLLGGSLLAQSLSEPSKRCEPTCEGCGTQSFTIGERHGQEFKLIIHFNEYRWGLTGTHWYVGFPVLAEYNDSCLRASHITYRKRQKGDIATLRSSFARSWHFERYRDVSTAMSRISDLPVPRTCSRYRKPRS